MKICPTCNTELDDQAVFCHNCGARQGEQQQQPTGQPQPGYTPPNYQPNYTYQQPNGYAPPMYQPYDPYDHTAEYDQKDISENKVLCMLVYLMGTIGIIIALLAGKDSKYLNFHVRQALKFSVVEILVALVTVVLCWTVIVPIVAGVLAVVLLVVKIICFFQICSGKAKEPVIIRSLGFLK